MYKRYLWLICLMLSACGANELPEAQTEAENAGERAALAAGSALPQPTTATELLSCEPSAGMTPYCGFQNPEDLVQIPDTNLLIVSEMGEFMADAPGDLSLLDTTTGRRQTLTINWSASATQWGEADCPPPAVTAFSPHGIDLVTRDDGAVSLLVVNHGGRESVEFFGVAPTGELSWQGCALPPGDPFINDVAARSDGGFYITHMWDKTNSFDETVAALRDGKPTGWVWAWDPTDGFSRLPESDDLMPNGIAIDADNNTLYVNVYFGNKVFALDLATQTRSAELTLRQPDNVSVDADGSLWVASHQHDPIGQACTEVTAGPCLLPFQVVKIDPATFTEEVIINHEGAPMGYATVALKVGSRVYLGTAHGDRVVSVELSDDA